MVYIFLNYFLWRKVRREREREKQGEIWLLEISKNCVFKEISKGEESFGSATAEGKKNEVLK
jgi:hypothetical protein